MGTGRGNQAVLSEQRQNRGELSPAGLQTGQCGSPVLTFHHGSELQGYRLFKTALPFIL